MSQCVWRRSRWKPCGGHQPTEPVSDATDAERHAARVEKERSFVGRVGACLRAQLRPTIGQVAIERLTGGSTQQRDALLAALAHDAQVAACQVEIRELRSRDLADAQA